jgi:hypothetical protein
MNDVGLIALPKGRRLAIAIFVTDSPAGQAIRDAVIARIAKGAYDESIRAKALKRKSRTSESGIRQTPYLQEHKSLRAFLGSRHAAYPAPSIARRARAVHCSASERTDPGFRWMYFTSQS